MTTKNNAYPLFGAPFNEAIDYGFDIQSLITPFLQKQQKVLIDEKHDWKCTKSYCLYHNKDLKTKSITTDPTESTPLDIIKTSSSDLICHTIGSKQSVLRICKWNDNNKLKNGYTLPQKHEINGISHCYDYFNQETIILSWTKHNAVFLGMNESKNDYKFDVIQEFEPSSNATFQSGILCSLPFVWNSGIEDCAFFTSNGYLSFCQNNGDKTRKMALYKDKEIPFWSELIWSTHPRIIRFSSDMELLTIDLRINNKCAQKHLYFDPITGINAHKNFIATVGLQGLSVYDDRMLAKPLIKWRFYEFDFLIGDDVFSKLQIYPLNDTDSEHWIICYGQSGRVLIYPFYAKTDSPLRSTMPFNINKYVQCLGNGNVDIGINGVLAANHKNKHHIITMSRCGTLLCNQFELKFQNDETEIDLIGNELMNDNKYVNVINQSKMFYLCKEIETHKNDILLFTKTPKNIEDIYGEFKNKFHDLKGLTLFDYFDVFMNLEIGLNVFKIQSIANMETIEDVNILNVINTYFVSQLLDENYLLIEDNDIDEEGKEETLDDDTNDTINLKQEDKLDLSYFSQLSQDAASQQTETIDLNWNNISDGQADIFNVNIDDNDNNGTHLFNTRNEITETCQTLLDSLCNKWLNGENNYVVNDWRVQNGKNNIDYNGMAGKRGSAPKHLKRRLKRVWL